MGIRCRSCHLEFEFDPARAGEVVECPFCDRYNNMPLTDPDPASEAAEPDAGAAAPEESPSLNGWIQASIFCLPCPKCRAEVRLFEFDRLDPICPQCEGSLQDVELPSPEQIAAAGVSPEAAAEIKAIVSRLMAERKVEVDAQPRLVAEWMVTEFDRRDRRLPIAQTAAEVREKFGPEFTVVDEAGEPAIAPAVLVEFRRLTTNCIVCDAAQGFWRERRPGEDLVPRVRVRASGRAGERRKRNSPLRAPDRMARG